MKVLKSETEDVDGERKSFCDGGEMVGVGEGEDGGEGDF